MALQNPISPHVPPFLVEAVSACLLEQGIAVEDITFSTKGAFKKAYNTDIGSFSMEEERGKMCVTATINRDGLYDLLPEGLFHQTRGMQAVRTVREAVDEHKKYNEEEKNARKFFTPFEEMIYRYRILTEVSERNALYRVENKQFVQQLLEFWNINNKLPSGETFRMAMTMPYLNYVKGDKAQTATALSYILNKEVTIHEVEKYVFDENEQLVGLENMYLGVNAVLGNKNNEIMYGWNIVIHDFEDGEIAQFVTEEPMGKLLSRFAEIFIPMDRDVYFDFNMSEQKMEHERDYILGYGCTI